MKKAANNTTQSPHELLSLMDEERHLFLDYAASIIKCPVEGYEIINKWPNTGWIARRSVFSGSIYAVTNGRHTETKKFTSFAEESHTARFSAIQQGSKSVSWLKKGSAGLPSIWIYMLAVLTYPAKPEFYREQMIDMIVNHPDFIVHKFAFESEQERNGNGGIGTISFHDIKEVIGRAIANGIESHGTRFLSDISELSKCIECKKAYLNKEEKDFLKSVSEAANNLENVPFQKDVKLLWMQGRLGRSEDHFRRVRDKLGFSWLPAAKRGKSAIR